MFCLLKKEKKISFVPAKGTFHGEISISRLELQSMYLTLVFLAQQRQNRITIQVFFLLNFETITFISL